VYGALFRCTSTSNNSDKKLNNYTVLVLLSRTHYLVLSSTSTSILFCGLQNVISSNVNCRIAFCKMSLRQSEFRRIGLLSISIGREAMHISFGVRFALHFL